MPSHNMKPSEHAQKAVYPSQDIIPDGDRQLENTLKSISIYDTNFYTTSQAHRGKAKRIRVLGHSETDHTRIHMQNTHQNIISAPYTSSNIIPDVTHTSNIIIYNSRTLYLAHLYTLIKTCLHDGLPLQSATTGGRLAGFSSRWLRRWLRWW